MLSATFHHLPHLERVKLLRIFHRSNVEFLIAEPLLCSLSSFAICLFGWIPALAAPIFLIRQPGRWRRFLCCWLVPIAPFAFVIDGLVSAWRAWTETEWELVMACLATEGDGGYVFQRGSACVSVMRAA